MFKGVYGNSEAKNLLNDLIIKPFTQSTADYSSAISSILFIGPAGCGKTCLAKALAEELNSVVTYYHLHSSTIISHSKQINEQIKYFRDAIKRAVDARPSLLFLDDLASEDAMFPCAFTSGYKSELIKELKELKQNDSGGVALLGATQSPWNMDKHLWKLFDMKIYLKCFEFDERLAYFKQLLQNINLEDGVIEELAKNTHQYTASDLISLSRDISVIPLRILMNTTHFKVKGKNGKRVFAPCSSTDEGATKINLENISDEQLEFKLISKNDAMEMLQSASDVKNWENCK